MNVDRRERQREYARRYRMRHLTVVRARERAAKASDPQRSEKWRAYASSHREALNAAQSHRMNRRRAAMFGAPGSHTIAEWNEKIALLGACCIYCGRGDARLERDHKIPLARGGSDDITNVVPVCASCNRRKRNQTAAEFLAAGRAA